jgi:hypothetical protein
MLKFCSFHSAVPAIRGKDYGKSAMRAGPDYIVTDSGLQYKVCNVACTTILGP